MNNALHYKKIKCIFLLYHRWIFPDSIHNEKYVWRTMLQWRKSSILCRPQSVSRCYSTQFTFLYSLKHDTMKLSMHRTNNMFWPNTSVRIRHNLRWPLPARRLLPTVLGAHIYLGTWVVALHKFYYIKNESGSLISWRDETPWHSYHVTISPRTVISRNTAEVTTPSRASSLMTLNTTSTSPLL